MKKQQISKSQVGLDYILKRIYQSTKQIKYGPYGPQDKIDQIDLKSMLKILNRSLNLPPYYNFFDTQMWQLLLKYKQVDQEQKITINNLATIILKTIQSPKSDQQIVSQKLCEIFNVQSNSNKSIMKKIAGLTILGVVTSLICWPFIKIKNTLANHKNNKMDVELNKVDTIRGNQSLKINNIRDNQSLKIKTIRDNQSLKIKIQNCVRSYNKSTRLILSFCQFKNWMSFRNRYLWAFFSASIMLAIYFKYKHNRQKPQPKKDHNLL